MICRVVLIRYFWSASVSIFLVFTMPLPKENLVGTLQYQKFGRSPDYNLLKDMRVRILETCHDTTLSTIFNN
jgi:hypothetical protein